MSHSLIYQTLSFVVNFIPRSLLSVLVPISACDKYIPTSTSETVSGKKDDIVSTVSSPFQTLFITAVLGVVGSSAAYLMNELRLLAWVQFQSIYGLYHSSVTIQNTDKNYNAILDFITEKYLKNKKGALSNLQAVTQAKKRTYKDWIREWQGTDRKNVPVLELRPNDSSVRVKFIYMEKEISFYRSKGETITVGWDRKPQTMERMTLSLWSSDNSVITKLLQEAMEASIEKEQEGMNIFVLGSGWPGGWEKALTKRPRTMESVIFDVDDAEHLIQDAKKFLASARWYSDLGIPFRRGYLLYGPPGCGKTSFAQVLAGELKLDICILNLTHEGLNDNSLAENLREAPENAIILLEDVDAIFVERAVASKDKSSGVSFSGLLNAIDGVAAQEGKIFFMTTNHIEKLDPALIRPGRCDVKLEVRRASKLQFEKMYLRFFPGEEENAKTFMKRLPANEISMAQLQGHFLEFKSSPQECIENIPSLLNQTKPKQIERVELYDQLKRVGLEQYSAAFEFLGAFTMQAAKSYSISEIIDICPLLHFDISGQARMKTLLEENKDFMVHQFSFADLATVRETFLAFYPTTHERDHGEKPPLMRRQGSSEKKKTSSPRASDSYQFEPPSLSPALDSNELSDATLSEVLLRIDELSEKTDEVDIDYFLELFRRVQGTVRYEKKTNDISAYLVDGLSKKLSETLSKGGKGTVSMYQLSSLIDAYPDRPVQCVLAAEELIKPRPESSYKIPDITIFDFFKRAAALQDIYEIRQSTVAALLAFGSSKMKDERFASASLISDVIEKTGTININKIAFQLADKKKAIWEFLTAYTTKTKPPAAIEEAEEPVEKESGDQSEASQTDSRAAVTESDLPAAAEEDAVPLPTRSDLEDLAYSFACIVTDILGNGKVSVIELQRYFESKEYKNDPRLAVKDAAEKLLNVKQPRTPAAPVPAPREEWVYKWLNSFDETGVLADAYGGSFVGQGLSKVEDFTVGPVFDEALLKDIIGVREAGNRRKIVRMHEALIANPGELPDFSKAIDEVTSADPIDPVSSSATNSSNVDNTALPETEKISGGKMRRR